VKPQRRPQLVLASNSPRRRKLLADAGFDYIVVAPEINEVVSAEITLREATSWNALRKGLAVARLRPNDIVLAADTLVALDGHVLGKPANRADAARILRLLSGRTHEVTTGVFAAHLHSGQSETFCVTSQVAFKKLSDQMIQDYLARIDPLDKAGAYAAQGKGRVIISRISGSRTNVIGLPLEKTRAALKRFGLRPRRRTSA
jgi:septum formation protein